MDPTTSDPAPIRILIVDDHPFLREGLIAILSSEPDMVVVAEAGDGRQAIDLALRYRPDVTIVDLRLPVLDGCAAISGIRRDWPDARILVLTTYDGEDDVHRALQAGARGYLLKRMARHELIAAIRAIHDGRRWVPPEVADRLADRVAAPELTSRELEVLSLIVAGRHNQEIGEALSISEKTVKTHVTHILGKLGVEARGQAINVALRRGLVRLD
jgi:DNA-binding NarL/FixJ family response regulator